MNAAGLLPTTMLVAAMLGAAMLGAGCAISPAPPAIGEGGAAQFTDAALARLLDAETLPGVSGILYIWSPHMPYSVQGLAEVLALGKRLELTVVPLLDPDADAGLAARVVQARHLPREVLRPMRSNRLLERGVTLHYPTLVLFREGRLLESMLPGYVSPAVCEAFVRGRLGALSG